MTKVISLDDIGVSGLAWFRDDALGLLDSLAGSPVAVLGVDVFRRTNDSYEHTLDVWVTRIRAGEQWLDYAARSRRETINYLGKYPDPGKCGYVYALVLTDKPDVQELLAVYDRQQRAGANRRKKALRFWLSPTFSQVS